jgi:hypothetical protein
MPSSPASGIVSGTASVGAAIGEGAVEGSTSSGAGTRSSTGGGGAGSSAGRGGASAPVAGAGSSAGSAEGCPWPIASERTYLPGPTRTQVTGADAASGSAVLAALRERARPLRGLGMAAAAGSRRTRDDSDSADAPTASETSSRRGKSGSVVTGEACPAPSSALRAPSRRWGEGDGSPRRQARNARRRSNRSPSPRRGEGWGEGASASDGPRPPRGAVRMTTTSTR